MLHFVILQVSFFGCKERNNETAYFFGEETLAFSSVFFFMLEMAESQHTNAQEILSF